MKICIELDEEMREEWEIVKESLEKESNYQNDTSISLTNSEIFKGILKSWKWGSAEDVIPYSYALSFSEEEIEVMKNRKQRNSS